MLLKDNIYPNCNKINKIMSELTLSESKVQGQSPTGTVPSLSWQDSLPVQCLLDVISSILANEYIITVKQNPEVFTEIASPRLGGAHNDGGAK